MTVTTPITQTKRTASSKRLDLETTRPSASTSTLELAALALDVGLLVGVGTHAEMLDGLTGVLGSTEEEGVGSSGEAGGDLIHGEALAAGLLDAGTGRGGEAHGRDGELGELEETVVVSDGSDLILLTIAPCVCMLMPYNDDGLALVCLGGVLVGSGRDDLRQADGYRRVSGHVHRCVRSVFLRGRFILDIMRRRRTVLLKGASVRPVAVSTRTRANLLRVLTGQELVQTHQQLDVGVGGLGDLCILVNPRARYSCCV
jgi:hypothetical protein